MMFFTLVLSCMIAISLGCDNEHCRDPVLANELMEINFLPNEEELRTLCPKVKTFLECQRDFIECSGRNLAEYATPIIKLGARQKALLAGIDIVRDICDEDSSFHTDYVANVNCYREFMNGPAKRCRDDILKPIEEFIDQYYSDVEEDDFDYEVYLEYKCLRDISEAACVIDNLGEACGVNAQKTAQNAVERLEPALGLISCKRLENSADLKSRFLDFLELDEQKRSNYQGVFDLFKRRR